MCRRVWAEMTAGTVSLGAAKSEHALVSLKWAHDRKSGNSDV